MQNTSEVHAAYLHFAKHFESFKKKKKNKKQKLMCNNSARGLLILSPHFNKLFGMFSLP